MNIADRLKFSALAAAMPQRLRRIERLGLNRRARLIRISVVAALLLFAAVLAMPVRLWMGQQSEIDQAAAQLAELEQSNAALEDQVDELLSPRSIERQARADFGWVFEGEETYTVTPASDPYVALPDVWPFDQMSDVLAGAASDR